MLIKSRCEPKANTIFQEVETSTGSSYVHMQPDEYETKPEDLTIRVKNSCSAKNTNILMKILQDSPVESGTEERCIKSSFAKQEQNSSPSSSYCVTSVDF